ncbi:diacylglycerol kinase, partial [Vibrio sp. FNV 38]|nr:diacylglycerol kinase [Vibrio sp. FNV 38]
CMNSAMEQLCDRVTGEQEEPIRRVKDMAAGGVLLCAVGALAVAAAVFGEAGFWKTVWNRILYEGQAWAAFPLLGLPVAALSAALPMKQKKNEKQAALPDYTIEEIEEEDGNH